MAPGFIFRNRWEKYVDRGNLGYYNKIIIVLSLWDPTERKD